MRWLPSRVRNYLRRVAWLTRLVDAYQIWQAQFGGWLTKVAFPMLAAALVWVTTYFQESWLPMATVAGVGAYIIVREPLHAGDSLTPILRAELDKIWHVIKLTADTDLEARKLSDRMQEETLSLVLLGISSRVLTHCDATLSVT